MIDLCLNTDGNLENNFTDDPFHLFIQELSVLFSLDETDFYGQPRVINLKKYILSKSISNKEIEKEIRDSVILNCEHSGSVSWNVEVNFISAKQNKDVVYIIFNIYGADGRKYTNQFVIGDAQ